MKKLTFGLLAFATVCSIQFTQAQTADEIVNKHIDALGGKEKLLALKSVKMEGSMNVQGMDIGITTTVVQGVGSRTDISVPGMGEGFQIMNTTKGWNFMPFQGQASPEEVPAAKVAASQQVLDVQGALLDYAAKGNKIELLGKEVVDGSEAYKLQLTSKAGRVFYYFIDSKTFLRVKAITKAITGSGEPDVEVGFGDFKKTPEGYTLPFTLTNPMGTVIFTTVGINKPVDEKIFTAE